MTNEIIQAIKAEIERRIKELDEQIVDIYDSKAVLRKDELQKLLSFLSTLESEKPMNQDELEEEIHKYNKERFDEYFPEQDGDFISEVDFMTCLGRVARHFAQWGAEHLKK